MRTVTLTDIRIADQDLDTLPLLASLRRNCFAAQTVVCIERARYVTTFLRRYGICAASPIAGPEG